jgi:hypothetical protein
VGYSYFVAISVTAEDMRHQIYAGVLAMRSFRNVKEEEGVPVSLNVGSERQI